MQLPSSGNHILKSTVPQINHLPFKDHKKEQKFFQSRKTKSFLPSAWKVIVEKNYIRFVNFNQPIFNDYIKYINRKIFMFKYTKS